MLSHDRGLHKEIPGTIPGRLITPDHFGLQWKINADFRDKVAGVTTLSATHLEQSFQKGTIELRPWKSIEDHVVNIALSDTVFHSLANTIPIDAGSDWVKTNRDSGFAWTAVELAREWGFRDSDLFPASRETWVYNLMPKFRGIRSLDEAEKRLQEVRSPSDAQYLRRSIIQIFGSLSELTRFTLEWNKRSGVQIIYGRTQAFTDFVRRQRYQYVDNRGIELFTSVPNHLITGIIPLGEHERRRSLRWK